MKKSTVFAIGVWGMVLLGLTVVFGLYIDPALMVRLAEQLWACF